MDRDKDNDGFNGDPGGASDWSSTVSLGSSGIPSSALKKLRAVLRKRGGELVANWERGGETYLKLRCQYGHQWNVTLRPVAYQGSWCRECAVDSRRLGIEAAQQLAEDLGGRCLSTQYVNSHTLMRWECAEGHRFEQTVNEIKHKKVWCRTCQPKAGRCRARGKLSFDSAIALATKAGGKHLGTTSKVTLETRWQCANGHAFRLSAREMILRDYFCDRCDSRQAKTLRKAQATAIQRGGRCLSTEYTNNYEPMEWECAEGHQWMAPWKNVGANKSWCRICADSGRRKAP